jgi:hypothetical protein
MWCVFFLFSFEGVFYFRSTKLKGSLLIPNDDRILVINIALAEEIGLEESLMLLRLDFLVKIASGNVYQEDTKFTYQSSRDLQKKYFPFWSYKTVQRVLQSLEDSKLIYRSKKNYNKHKYDKTIWYAINYKEVAKLSSIKVDWDVVEANKKLASKTLGQNDPGLGQNDPSLGQNDPSLGQNDPSIPGYYTGKNTGKNSNNASKLRDRISGRILTNKTVETLVKETYSTKDKNILEALKAKVNEEIENGSIPQKIFWKIHTEFSQNKSYNLFASKLKLDSPDGQRALELFQEYQIDEKTFVEYYIKRWQEHKSQNRVWYPTWNRIITTLNEFCDRKIQNNKAPQEINKADWYAKTRKKID